MLTEQEIINNALKEMLYMEQLTAQKYAEATQQITKPELQNLIKGMERCSKSRSCSKR